LAVIVTGQLMLILDATVVNIALPHIQAGLHFSATSLAWVLNAYTLAFGGILLFGGRAGDILGRRRVFLAGVALFTLASLLGGIAASALWLVAARAAQGIGAGLAAPSVLALIASTYADGTARTRALGIYSAVSAGGGSLGLVLGGMLTSWASWRWVLLVNVPIGIAVVLAAPRVIREPERHPGRFDLGGALTSTAGMALLVFGFIRAASGGWRDPQTLGSFAAAAVLLALFLFTETRASQPITPLRLLADRGRSGAYLAMLLMAATSLGMFFFLTQFVQEILGFSPATAGVAFLPLTAAVFACMRVVPRLLPRFGPGPFILAGITLVVAAMAWLTQVSAVTGYVTGILGPMLIYGIGTGITFLSLSTIILSRVPPHDSGAASGLLQAMQQAGGTLGLAILVTVFGTVSRDAARHPPAGASPHPHYVLAHGIASAFTAATLYAIGALLVAVLLIRTRKPSNPDHPATPARR
jgi:EmrB/QacA subfamily drug resistance transporter